MKKILSWLLLSTIVFCVAARHAGAGEEAGGAEVPARFAGYIEILGDRYPFGATVGDFAKNGWVDKKTDNPKSFKYFADMGTVIPAGINCNPLIEFSKDGYAISVFAFGNELKEDSPVGNLIVQRIEIVSDRVTGKNDVPWALDNGFSHRDTMERMMALYPQGRLEDEEDRRVDDRNAENSYTASYLNGSLPKDGLWASLYMEHRNERREMMFHYNTYEYIRSPRGMKLYAAD